MKRALVISGGGSKGAFAVGVLQGFKTSFPNLNFDIIVGTSAGALVAPMAALQETDLLEQIFTSVTTEQVVTAHRIGDRLNEKSIFTVEPLYQLIKAHITDDRYKRIKSSGKNVSIITTNLQTEGVVVYNTQPTSVSSAQYSTKTIKDAEHLRLSILGSACQPVMMTPVMIDFNYTDLPERDHQYVDGGVREYAGIQMAIDQGATEVFSILLSPDKGEEVTTEFASLFPLLQRALSIFTEDVQKNDVFLPEQYEKAVEYIAAVKQKMKSDGIPQAKIDDYFTINGNPFSNKPPVKIFIIRPDSPLGGGPGGLVFDPVEMRGMIEKGKRAATGFIAGVTPADKSGWA